MTSEIMSQAAAAERAWMFAEIAENEAYRLARGADLEHPSVDVLLRIGNLWTVVAGQFEMTDVALDEQPVDVPGPAWQSADEAVTETTLRVPVDLLATAVITMPAEGACRCRNADDPHPVGGFGCVHAARREEDWRPAP